RVACASTEARRINEPLRMLDAESDRERLWLDVDATIMKHLERIARTMGDGEHHVFSGDMLAACKYDAAYVPRAVAPGFDGKIGDAAFKTVFAAQRFDGAAHILHHFHQPESADMRVRLG